MRNLIRLSILIGCIALTSCTINQQTNVNTETPTPKPIITDIPPTEIKVSVTPTATEELEEQEILVWVDDILPESMFSFIDNIQNYSLIDKRDDADLIIEYGEDDLIANLIFAFAAPFPTIADNVSISYIKNLWGGSLDNNIESEKIIVSDEYVEILSILLGEPDLESVHVMYQSEMLDYAWTNEDIWALLLFDQIEPKWKILSIDDQSPIRNDFDLGSYSLNFPISISGNESYSEIVAGIPQRYIRDKDQLTTIVLTGVTALTRGTAWEMEQWGVLFPAEYIGDLLRDADITHISNEVPFVEDCPEPSLYQEGYVFCSDPSYIELLEFVGTDIVELTGDHFGDYSSDDVLSTFAMYEKRGWKYYGAGIDIVSGRSAITLEHNSNKIAFIGCNGKGYPYTPTNWGQPGAVECDYDWLPGEIQRLKSNGYLVIFTFQHNEEYDFDTKWKSMKPDFILMAESGADIVSGSQAHQPHDIEFVNNSIVMFGLGNTFFDLVYGGEYLDIGMIARHVIYDNQYISTEIFTIKFISYSQPRFMTDTERSIFLEELFDVSGWK